MPGLLWLLVGIALALRLPGLGRSELWFDEAATWWFGRLAASGRLAETLALEPTPPLYYLLTGTLARLFGDSEVVLRLPAVFFGVLSIVSIYLLADELFERRVALWSAALLAVHPLHVFYSREARVYPLLTCLLPLALWLSVRTARSGSRRPALGVFATLTMLCYSHMYALFVVPLCLAVGLLFLPKASYARNLGLLLIAIGGALVLWLPYLIATVPRLSDSGAAWSVSVFYEQNPGYENLLRAMAELLLGANYHSDLRQLSLRQVASWLWLPGLALQITLLVLAVTRVLRAGKRRTLLALTLMWPLLIVPPWLLTLLGRPMFLPGRHDVLCLGFVCCWLALGIVELLDRRRAAAARRGSFEPLRWLTLPALLFLALLVLQRLVWIHIETPATYHRQTARFLAQSVQPGDVVVATGIRRLVTQYYLGRMLRANELPVELWREGEEPSSEAVSLVSHPRSTDRHPGWADALTLIEDPARLALDARRFVEALEVAQPVLATRTVWTLERDYPRSDGAVSVSFLVDRHLFRALSEEGFSPVTAAELEQVRRWTR